MNLCPQATTLVWSTSSRHSAVQGSRQVLVHLCPQGRSNGHFPLHVLRFGSSPHFAITLWPQTSNVFWTCANIHHYKYKISFPSKRDGYVKRTKHLNDALVLTAALRTLQLADMTAFQFSSTIPLALQVRHLLAAGHLVQVAAFLFLLHYHHAWRTWDVAKLRTPVVTRFAVFLGISALFKAFVLKRKAYIAN